MKSITIINFLIAAMIFSSSICLQKKFQNETSIIAPRKENETQNKIKLFKYPPPTGKCNIGIVLPIFKNTTNANATAAPHQKICTPCQKEYGFGPSAYFFDYLDPLLQKNITEEFKRIFSEAKKIISSTALGYTEPYSLESILGIPTALAPPEQAMLDKIKSTIPNFNSETWKIVSLSLRYAQLFRNGNGDMMQQNKILHEILWIDLISMGMED